MSTITVKYDILISGMYPFKGDYKKNGFSIKTNKVDDKKVETVFNMGVLYLSPYLGFCCYPDENGDTVYLTFNKDIEMDIDYGQTVEYNCEFTTNYLQSKNLFDEIDDLEKVMTLEINNYIKFPIKIIKAFDPQGKMIAMLGDIEKTNLPTLLNTNINVANETIKRQQNRLGNRFSYKEIIELKNNNEFFDNALTIYFSSFSVADEKIGFVLLITALESLLNLSTYSKPKKCKNCGQDIYQATKTIAENVGLILMNQEQSFIKEIKELYGKRSNYIHKGIQEITKTDEQKLQEHVRKVLLMYWHVSMQKKTFDHNVIITYIQSPKYKSCLMCRNFLTALNNMSFKEIQSEVLKQIFGGIINGTVKIEQRH